MNKFALSMLLAIGTSMMIAPVASAQEVVVEEYTYFVNTDDLAYDDPAYIDEDYVLAPDDGAIIIRDDEEAVVLDDDDDDFDDAVVAETIISDDDAVDRCATQFRSFDPATGTYVGYDGLTHPCPYLP